MYSSRRWTASRSTLTKSPDEHLAPAQTTLCPACKQQRTGEPRGFVFLDGDFFSSHAEEIEQLLRNEAKRAAEDNPLATKYGHSGNRLHVKEGSGRCRSK